MTDFTFVDDKGSALNTRRIVRGAVPIAAVILLVLLPWLADLGFQVPMFGGGAFLVREVEIILIYSMVVVGLNLTYGYAGEFALGNAAMFAAGAYTAAILTQGTLLPFQIPELLITLPASVLAAGFVGLFSGVPGLRLSGWALAYTSFFLVLIVPNLAVIFQDVMGGYTGLSPIPLPTLAGFQLGGFSFYLVIVVVATVIFAAFRNIARSRHGNALHVLRQSPVLASSLGISVYRIKLTAYVVAALPAGAAGCLMVYLNSFVSPGFFDMYTTIGFIAASVLGGSRTVFGALLGATVVQVLGPLNTSTFQQFAYPVYGLLLLVGGVLLTGGIGGTLKTWFTWIKAHLLHTRPKTIPPAPQGKTLVDVGPFDGAPLVLDGVDKSFGGNHAVNMVSLEAQPGKVTALIGPNGSGKTTVLNLVCGFYRLDAGTIMHGDVQLSGLSPTQVARHTVARTFQTPSIPNGLTCLNAVGVARFTQERSSLLAGILRLPSYGRKVREDHVRARRALSAVGLLHLANVEAASLPLGSRRLLEVARALAAQPSLILLDEPASGLDGEDIRRLSEILRAAACAGATVIVIEHNFEMVLDVADVVYVLNEGQVLTQGIPDEIRRDPRVLESYLGEAEEASK
jgi:branched-chain amino acid transport system permease protein